MKTVDIDKLVPAFILPIASVTEADGGYVLTFTEDSDISDPITVPAEYVAKYSPKPGGYYIMCTNGVGMYSE